MSNENSNNHAAAGSFTAEDVINPVALAKQLRSGKHPFCKFLLGHFSPAGQAGLAALPGPGTNPGALARLIANELSGVAAGGKTFYDPVLVNGTKLRRSTARLIKRNPQGAELERLNTLLIQDCFPKELEHDSCELVEVVKKKGIEFRIYKERRRLKTKWNVSYRITYPATDGLTSTHAPSLEEAYTDIDTLVEQVLSGRTPTTKKENKERDAKAGAYDEIATEAAKVGKTEPKDAVEFVKDAVKAQVKIGLGRPLLEFTQYAVEVLVKPVTRCLLLLATAQYREFVMARNDIGTCERRRTVTAITRFAEDMSNLWQARSPQPAAGGTTLVQPSQDVHVDELRPNDIQTWANGLKMGWKSRRDYVDRIRAFFKYCQEALHAIPPGKTAAQVVPRPKPDSNAVPVPATVLSFTDIWRLLINLQDLESVFFVAIGVFAGLHGEEIARLVWEDDITWKNGLPIQIFVASGKGKDKNGKRLGQHVTVRHPLDRILALGKGRTGYIVTRRFTRQDMVTPIINRLQILWDESIMRHTFASVLFGIGFSFGQVAQQMRNTETVLRRHYYAPIPLPEAEQYWTLPVDIFVFASLPFRKRFWNRQAPLRQFPFPPQDGGGVANELPPFPPRTMTRRKSTIKRNRGRMVWPDDMELLVLLWEKPQEAIARDFDTVQTSVSSHGKARGLKPPKFNYWIRLKRGLSVEVPEAVIKARQELLARKNAAAAKAGEGSATPPSTPSTTEDHDQKPPAAPENQERETTSIPPNPMADNLRNNTMNTSTLMIETPEPLPAAAANKACIGIDNGTSGAIACITPAGDVICGPVIFQDLGKEKLMDIDGNLALLRRMIAATGLPTRQIMAVFEQAQITPKFGYKNCYTNGRNNEFWRVVLSMAQIPFKWANPREWQKPVFAGIRGDDTKEMADLVRRQQFPNLDLSGYTQIQTGGINDAVCIALWVRQTFK